MNTSTKRTNMRNRVVDTLRREGFTLTRQSKDQRNQRWSDGEATIVINWQSDSKPVKDITHGEGS